MLKELWNLAAVLEFNLYLDTILRPAGSAEYNCFTQAYMAKMRHERMYARLRILVTLPASIPGRIETLAVADR